MYRKLNSTYLSFGYDVQGDFAERMSRVLGRIEDEYAERYGNDSSKMLSTPEITELLHKNEIIKLEKDLAVYLQFKDGVWILFTI